MQVTSFPTVWMHSATGTHSWEAQSYVNMTLLVKGKSVQSQKCLNNFWEILQIEGLLSCKHEKDLLQRSAPGVSGFELFREVTVPLRIALAPQRYTWAKAMWMRMKYFRRVVFTSLQWKPCTTMLLRKIQYLEGESGARNWKLRIALRIFAQMFCHFKQHFPWPP